MVSFMDVGHGPTVCLISQACQTDGLMSSQAMLKRFTPHDSGSRVSLVCIAQQRFSTSSAAFFFVSIQYHCSHEGGSRAMETAMRGRRRDGKVASAVKDHVTSRVRPVVGMTCYTTMLPPETQLRQSCVAVCVCSGGALFPLWL